MGKMIKVLFYISLLVCSNSFAHAQSDLDRQKLRGYYFAAEAAVKSSDFNEALDALDRAKNLRGKTDTRALSLRVKSFMGLERIEEAKRTLEELYSRNPSLEIQQEMAPILLEIDKKIEASEKAEEERIADEKKQAVKRAESLKRQAEQQAEFEEKKRLYNIRKAEFEAERRQIKSEIWDAALNKGKNIEVLFTRSIITENLTTTGNVAELTPWNDIVFAGKSKEKDGGEQTLPWMLSVTTDGELNFSKYSTLSKDLVYGSFLDLTVRNDRLAAVGYARDNSGITGGIFSKVDKKGKYKDQAYYNFADKLTAVAKTPGGFKVSGSEDTELKICDIDKDGIFLKGIDCDSWSPGTEMNFSEMITDSAGDVILAYGYENGGDGVYYRGKTANQGKVSRSPLFKNSADVGRVQDALQTSDRGVIFVGSVTEQHLTNSIWNEFGGSGNKSDIIIAKILKPSKDRPEAARFTKPALSTNIDSDNGIYDHKYLALAIGSNDDEVGKSIVRSSNGGLIIAAERTNDKGEQQVWLVGLSKNYEMDWHYLVPKSELSEVVKDKVLNLWRLDDGTFMLAGTRDRAEKGQAMLVLKFRAPE